MPIESETHLVYLAVLQDGQLLLTRNAVGRWGLPYFYEKSTTPWDINPIQQAWQLFGWSVDLVRRPIIGKLASDDLPVLCAVCQFDADHKSAGAINEVLIRRAWPSLLKGQLTDCEDIVQIVLDQEILTPVSEQALSARKKTKRFE